jgi:hypothetical protein
VPNFLDELEDKRDRKSATARFSSALLEAMAKFSAKNGTPMSADHPDLKAALRSPPLQV